MNYDIKSYVDQLFAEKGGVDLDVEIAEQMKLDLQNRVENLINSQILKNMPKDSLDEFETVLDKGSDVEVQNFCREKIPNLEEIVASTLLNFRNQYLG